MSTFYKEFSNEKLVVIPSIQREYVQPLNESIICGFVDALIKAYQYNQQRDLNYIYGIDTDSYFEPIDGQQRLTTLWLIHLYIAAKVGGSLPARLEYRTRDVSSDFCIKLRENCRLILPNSKCPSQDIKNANWFIETWTENITVSSMLHALDVIHQRIASSDVDLHTVWQNMKSDDSTVTFAFKSTKDLGDDVYVKMNARGKSLSDFENLKSWLDDKLVELKKDEKNKLDEEFLRDWREKIDNDWTDLFWRNRNLNDLFPEEIDDEQMRLFYNIAFIIWAQKAKSEKTSIIRNPKDVNLIASLLKVEATSEKIVEAILSRMRRSTVDMPLYLLDKLNVFDAEFFTIADKILDGLIKHEKIINTELQAKEDSELSDKIYFWNLPETKEPIKFLCQLLMSESGSDVPYAKMVIGAALCYYVQNEENKTSLVEWMRFIRNVANNITIDAESIESVLSAIKGWALLCASNEIDEVITQAMPGKRGFESKQLEEEKAKVALFDVPLTYKTICRLENHNFFFGRIGFLLRLLKDCDTDYHDTLIAYANLLQKLFGNNGPRFDTKDDKYMFHRVVLALSQYHGYGYDYKRSWCLIESKEEWKYNFLEDFAIDNEGIQHNIGISRLLYEIGTVDNLSLDTLKKILDKYKEKVIDWRRPLLEHSGLWNYMGSNCLKFENNFNVLLIPGVVLQSSGRRSELRARSLYLDLKYGEDLRNIFPPINNEEFKPNGWTLKYWDYSCDRKDKNSCIFFEKNNNDEKLVIDIYFDVEYAYKHSTEDSYCIELFVRENNRNNDDLKEVNKNIWQDTIDRISGIEVNRDNSQGRYVYLHLPKHGILSLLKDYILKIV